MLNLLMFIMVAILLGYTIWQTVESYLNRVALGQAILRGKRPYTPHDK